MQLLGIKPASDHEMAHSQEELRLILAHSEKAGILSEENREIIEGVFQFSKRTARQWRRALEAAREWPADTEKPIMT